MYTMYLCVYVMSMLHICFSVSFNFMYATLCQHVYVMMVPLFNFNENEFCLIEQSSVQGHQKPNESHPNIHITLTHTNPHPHFIYHQTKKRNDKICNACMICTFLSISPSLCLYFIGESQKKSGHYGYHIRCNILHLFLSTTCVHALVLFQVSTIQSQCKTAMSLFYSFDVSTNTLHSIFN